MLSHVFRQGLHLDQLLGLDSIPPLSHFSPLRRLYPLQVTLARFALIFYERAFRFHTSFSIGSLARLGVKPALSRSF